MAERQYRGAVVDCQSKAADPPGEPRSRAVRTASVRSRSLRDVRAAGSTETNGAVPERATKSRLMHTIAGFRGTPDDVSEAVEVGIRRAPVIHETDHRFATLIEENVLNHRGSANRT